MNRVKMVSMAMILVLAFGAGAQATTGVWVTPHADGTKAENHMVQVQANATVQLYLVLDSDFAGSALEAVVGYDVTDKTTYGTGGNPTLNKLTMVSSDAEVLATIPAEFSVLRTWATVAAREANNPFLGGRPYGKRIQASRWATEVPGRIIMANFTIRNNMPAGQSYYVVISDAGTGSSYTTRWSASASMYERASYALEIESVPEPASIGLLVGALLLTLRRRS